MSNGSLKQRLLRGSVWVFAGKFITGVAQILIAMVLTRILSPEDFGAFQVIQRALVFLAIIGSFGMGWVIVARIAEGLALNRPGSSVLHAISIFSVVIGVTIILSSAFALLGGQAVDYLFSINVERMMIILVGLLFCMSLQQVIPEAFRGLHDLKFASIFSGAATNSLMLSILLIVYFGFENNHTLFDMIIIYFLSAAIVVGVSGATLFRRFQGITKKVGKMGEGSVLTDNILAGIPLTLTGLLSFVVKQTDIWIIAAMFSVADSAYYGAASRLNFAILAPVMVANGATRGIIADLWAKKNTERLQRLLRTVASLTTIVAIFPAMLFVFLGAPLLAFLYGDQYAQASGVLAILVLGQLIVLMAGPAGTLMVLSGYQNKILYIDVISALLFCSCAYFLGHLLGPVGVAIAYSISISIQSFCCVFFAKKYLNITTYVGRVSRVGCQRRFFKNDAE